MESKTNHVSQELWGSEKRLTSEHYVILDWGTNNIVARFLYKDNAEEHMKTAPRYSTWILYKTV
jgi:hypothetical protein